MYLSNPNDWLGEATTMRDVYSHSLFSNWSIKHFSCTVLFERYSFAECAYNIHTTWDLKLGEDGAHPNGMYRAFPAYHWTNNVE